MEPTVNIVRFPQLQRTVEIPAGARLLEAISLAGIHFGQLCGGTGSCKRCKVKIIEGQVNGHSRNGLANDEVEQGFVLACLCEVHSPLSIEIPGDIAAGKRLKTETQSGLTAEEPIVGVPLAHKFHLSLIPPDLRDNRADSERLRDEIGKLTKTEAVDIGLDVLSELPTLLRQNAWSLTATVAQENHGVRVTRLQEGKNTAPQATIAVDIGTTSIAAQLLDNRSGAILASASMLNSQAIFGCDVTSRIMAAEKQGTDKLRQAVANDINSAVTAICHAAAIDKEHIGAVVCSGNTVMCHLLLGLDARFIRREPYIAATTHYPVVPAQSLGIDIDPRGTLYCLPGIGSWVGGDITAGIMESGIATGEEISLLMDIGTNGEIVIGNHEWRMASSASAGPALEGAGVECGMRATAGAIERVETIDGALRFKTIDDQPPLGICGSGIIDLVSALLELGVIDRCGRFCEAGKHQHVLVPADQSGTGREIAVTEADIENIIHAKAALYAAMRLMLKRLDLDFTAVRRFVIAGTFGHYIDIPRAISIGLLPDLPMETFVFAGNTSLAGARRAALDRESFLRLRDIARNTTYYDLLAAEDYVEEFRKASFLPHTDIQNFYASRDTQRGTS